MDSLWAWLAIAGLGALHGANPAGGWALAAAWGIRSRDPRQALRALLPIAVGHAASVALVAAAVVWGLAMDRVAQQVLAGGLLAVALALHLARRSGHEAAGHAGLALGAFLLSSAHGAGLMLVPALVPLCMGQGSAGASSSLSTALIAIAVHTAAMVAVSGLVAAGACRGFEKGLRLLRAR